MVRVTLVIAALALGASGCSTTLKCMAAAPDENGEESAECQEHWRKQEEERRAENERRIEAAKPGKRKECAALGMVFGEDVTATSCPHLCRGFGDDPHLVREHGCDPGWTCNGRYDVASDRSCGKAGHPDYCVRCANPLTAEEKRTLAEVARIEREKQEAEERARAEEKQRLEAAAQLRRDADAAEAQAGRCTQPRVDELQKVRDAILLEKDAQDRLKYQLDTQALLFLAPNSAKSMREFPFPPPGKGTIPAGVQYVFASIAPIRTQLNVDGSWGDYEWGYYDRKYDGVPFTIHFIRVNQTGAKPPVLSMMGAGCVLVVAFRKLTPP
jgi:hypothetical protein